MNRRHRFVRNHAPHASEGLSYIVRPLRGSPAAADRSFRCKHPQVIACALALLLALLAFGASATPVKVTGVLAGTTGSANPNLADRSWSASSQDFDGGVYCYGCGVPFLPDIYYGDENYVNSFGSIFADASASVTTAPVKFSATAPGLSITKAPGNGYTVNMSSGTDSFSQAAPQFSSTLGASLNFTNSVYGEICIITCSDDGYNGTFDAYSNSYNVLGASTVNNGTLSFFGHSTPNINGLHFYMYTPDGIDAGSIDLKPTSPLTGSGSLDVTNSVTTTIAKTSVDLDGIAASLGGDNDLVTEGQYQSNDAGGLDLPWNIGSAVLNLSEGLSQQASLRLGTDMNVAFYNADGTPLTVLSPLGQQEAGLGFAPGGSFTVNPLSPGQDLAGDYAVLTGNYQLKAVQEVNLSVYGDLDLSMLSGTFNGASFGPVYGDDIPLIGSITNLVLDSQTFDFTQSEKVYFPGSSVAVPEPPNWAFMLMGVIGIGVAEATRRRRADRKNWLAS